MADTAMQKAIAETARQIVEQMSSGPTGETLTRHAEQLYNVKRKPGQTDEELKAECEAKLASCSPWYVVKAEVPPGYCRNGFGPKPRKYPGECPCGIASVRCDYHKDA